MDPFVEAVQNTRNELYRRDFDPTGAIVYCHPDTLEAAKQEMDYLQPFTHGGEIFGMTIEATPNVPENIVATVHLNAVMYGPEAVQFAPVRADD